MRPLRHLPLLLALLAAAPPFLRAQDPALRDTLQQGKAAWASQGDRETASTRIAAVIAALEPSAQRLDAAWQQVLCEAYNWMAVLEDRVPAKRERAPRFLEAALALNPDFEVDRTATNARLQAAFDALRTARYGRIKLALDPAGGTLSLDGKPRAVGPGVHYLPPGPHAMTYARPGYAPLEQRFEVALKEVRPVNLALVRTSSTLTVFTSPAGAEVLVDGTSRGATTGQVPADLAAYAAKAGVRPDQLSAGFQLSGLTPGKHLLEFRLPCYQTKRLEVGEAFTTPFADHDLEPVKLAPSRSLLTILCPVPGGELFLSGKDCGPVPVQNLPACAGSYDLQVRFPAGSFSQQVQLAEGGSLTLAVRPKPRLTFAGLEGTGAFAGRDRIAALLAGLGARLDQVAFATAHPGETPGDCVARLQAAHDTELLLRARPAPGAGHEVELLVATLTGEEERLLVKPLEEDPLAGLVARLQALPVLARPWAGLALVDLPEGPWVLQADAAALKAGVKPFRRLLTVNGHPAATVAEVQKALDLAVDGRITVGQGEAPVTLAVAPQPVELPLNAPGLCYPLVLADLRLRSAGAAGDGASLLRLQQALALMHFREYDKALEVLREARLGTDQGLCQGSLDYYVGVCLQHLGDAYLSETRQAFQHALAYPQATLLGPDGPLLAPLARQALDDLKP